MIKKLKKEEIVKLQKREVPEMSKSRKELFINIETNTAFTKDAFKLRYKDMIKNKVH